MCKWQCPFCLEIVQAAYLRNLAPLVDEHNKALCIYKDRTPEQLPLTESDKALLEELRVGWR